MFDVVIQPGAILSVVVLFRKRLLPSGAGISGFSKGESFDLWKKTIVGVLPALIVGALLHRKIEAALFNPIGVAIALAIGGVALIVLEGIRIPERVQSL